VGRTQDGRSSQRVLSEKLAGKSLLGIHTRVWEDNIKRLILKWNFKIWNGGVAWIGLTQDRERWRALLYAVMNLRGPSIAGNFLSS